MTGYVYGFIYKKKQLMQDSLDNKIATLGSKKIFIRQKQNKTKQNKTKQNKTKQNKNKNR